MCNVTSRTSLALGIIRNDYSRCPAPDLGKALNVAESCGLLSAAMLGGSTVFTSKLMSAEHYKTVCTVAGLTLAATFVLSILKNACDPHRFEEVCKRIKLSLRSASCKDLAAVLHEAIFLERDDLLPCLFEAGVRSTMENARGDHAYQHAVRSSQPRMIAQLAQHCKNGLDIGTQKSVLPPVLLAAAIGNMPCLTALVAAKADLQVKSSTEQWNALDFALFRRDVVMVEFLRALGLKPTKQQDILNCTDKMIHQFLSRYVDVAHISSGLSQTDLRLLLECFEPREEGSVRADNKEDAVF